MEWVIKYYYSYLYIKKTFWAGLWLMPSAAWWALQFHSIVKRDTILRGRDASNLILYWLPKHWFAIRCPSPTAAVSPTGRTHCWSRQIALRAPVGMSNDSRYCAAVNLPFGHETIIARVIWNLPWSYGGSHWRLFKIRFCKDARRYL